MINGCPAIRIEHSIQLNIREFVNSWHYGIYKKNDVYTSVLEIDSFIVLSSRKHQTLI